jgi:hypothetical protein
LPLAAVWGRLPPPNRRWLLVNALLVTAAINVIVNATIAWVGVRGQEKVSMWGVPLAETSVFWNVVGTLFLLPLITCVLTTTAIRRDVRRGTLVPLAWLLSVLPRLAALPRSRWGRGAAIGVLVTALLAPPLVFALVVSGSPNLSCRQFVACQTAFAVILGLLVAPPIALVAMGDPRS